MVSMAAPQNRGGGGNRGNRGNPGNQPNNQPNNNQPNNQNPRNRGNLPPEGSVREDTMRVTNKPRVMLEIVDLLQKRTGRPISYEDPLWAYEGYKERGPNGTMIDRPGDIKRTEAFKTGTGVVGKDTLTLTAGTYEFKVVADARTHFLPEPIDGSINGVLTTVLNDFATKQQAGTAGIVGSFAHGYLGDVNEGGFGWIVFPKEFKTREGKLVPPVRVLDYPISFPVEERPTHVTFQLIAELVTKESKQRVEFKKLATEANMTGRATELKPVELPKNQFVKIGATKETARSVIAKALRQIERGDPRTQGPIPQRAWRLLYSIDKQTYYLDVVDVRQENYQVNGSPTGTRPVFWPTATEPAPAASAPARGGVAESQK
jgi:hypothetical protein